MTQREDVPAGQFAAWLDRAQVALAEDGCTDMPCGECTACCRSSFFIHVRPEETDALAHIPAELLFPAPGLPAGNVLMGYDQDGRCPMLRDGACSIYSHRPRACRAFDCRVFSAAGIESDKALIDEQVRRWAFSYATARDSALHAAVRAAARFLSDHPECFPGKRAPGNSSHVALLAIKVYDVFLSAGSEAGGNALDADGDRLVTAVVASRRRFEGRSGAISSAEGEDLA